MLPYEQPSDRKEDIAGNQGIDVSAQGNGCQYDAELEHHLGKDVTHVEGRLALADDEAGEQRGEGDKRASQAE